MRRASDQTTTSQPTSANHFPTGEGAVLLTPSLLPDHACRTTRSFNASRRRLRHPLPLRPAAIPPVPLPPGARNANFRPVAHRKSVPDLAERLTRPLDAAARNVRAATAVAPARPAYAAGFRAALATVVPLVVDQAFRLSGGTWMSLAG